MELGNLKHITIKDIAKRAEVSVSTVSRVLNNATDVNAETRKKILRIIEELNYKPNPAAMALVKQRNRFIAVLIPNLNHSVISRVVRGIMSEAQKRCIDVLLFDYDYDVSLEKRHLELLSDKMIDGTIVITSIVPGELIMNLAKKMPVLLLDSFVEGLELDQVDMDDKQGMKILIDHLRSKGHEKIGMITGEIGTTSADLRSNNFKQFLQEYNVDYQYDQYMVSCHWSLMGGYQAFRELVCKKPDITAIICANDQIAIGALGAAFQMGIKVPEQLSIVGYDNFEEGKVSAPPLTTLSNPSELRGELAARFLLDRIENPKAAWQKEILPLNLLERKSVAKVRSEIYLNV